MGATEGCEVVVVVVMEEESEDKRLSLLYHIKKKLHRSQVPSFEATLHNEHRRSAAVGRRGFDGHERGQEMSLGEFRHPFTS